MNEHTQIAAEFEAQRPHLRMVAYRMLGSVVEADDAVQEAWLRFSRTASSGIENLGGWLTTVVARICLDMLRTRKSRREEPLDADWELGQESSADPENEVIMADAVGLALLVVLETLTPAERLAFVLHDMFDVSFDEIAPIVGRSATAARQLASRARRRVQSKATQPDAVFTPQREMVAAFLAASRGGDFAALLALLDPDIVVRADNAAVEAGAAREVRGAAAVAQSFLGRARFAQPALVNGAVGAVWVSEKMRVVFRFSFRQGKIAEIAILADPDHLSQLELEVLSDEHVAG